MTTNSKSKSLYLLLIILEFLIIGWLIYDKVQTKKETEKIINELEYSKTEKDSIANELITLYEDYDNLKTNNDTLNAKLASEQARIKQLIDEIKKVKASNKQEIEKYKKELETLRKIMRSYIVQIDSLNTRNQILMAENKKIKNEYQKVVDEKEDLESVKDSLTGQIEVASTLKALNTNTIALNSRNKRTSRRSKAVRIKTCFTISENLIAQKGPKDVYIRIAKPDGNILLNEHSGFFRFGEKEISYSAKRQINYQGQNTDVCIYYQIRENLEKGEYTVNIFADGKQIGTSTFKLK